MVPGAPVEAPAVSVCVPSHDRPLRLRWLLEALADQTCRDFEVVVAHDSSGRETDELLATHRLGVCALRCPPSGPAAKRNAAWRAARGELVAFTDDDTRPAPDWLARLVAAHRARPGAVLQGAVRPDPAELELAQRVAHARTVVIDPPTAWGQTANVAYPRELLERLGGFDEAFPDVGDDTDLLQRALAAGAPQVAVPEALVHHMVEADGLWPLLRTLRRWRGVPATVKRHPHLRDPMPLRLFWKTRHATFLLALAGLALGTRRSGGCALVLPWVREALPAYGRSPRGLARAVSELPGRAIVDAVEVGHVLRGAVSDRSPLI